MSSPKRRLLVTSALPYANGQIHIGHLVEYVQTDIWVRFQRMRGHEVHYVGADDTHGTPIMLRAEKEGLTPKELIANVWKEHKRDFDDFLISFDNYYTTDSPENEKLSQSIYLNFVMRAWLKSVQSSKPTIPLKKCSCRIALSKASALSVALKINTVTLAKNAEQPTPQPI